MPEKSYDLKALNEAQRSAVMHGEGPLLVLAGPGSGKTFTITQRILYLIDRMHVPPEEILVITFTKDAALSMEQRFQKTVNRILPVNFGTFHSVFYQILRNSYTSHIGQILGESQKRALLFPILKKFRDVNQTNDDCLSFLSAISLYKNIGNMEQALEKLPPEKQEIFPAVFQEYERVRKKSGSIDFDDMVYECRELLQKNSNIREYWNGRFSHILMDEFQDINPMQYQVIKLISGTSMQLFAVGDDDQSIYGFRGSRPACMQQFAEEFHAKKVLLAINYRSTPSIVEASLKVIAENKDRFSKELRPCENNKSSEVASSINVSSNGQVLLQSFQEWEEECAFLIKQLRSREEGESRAVLFRTNVQMQKYAAVLNQKGILYEMKEKNVSIYEHFIVKDIMAYMRIASGENQRELYLRILNKPQRNLSRETLWMEVSSSNSVQRFHGETSTLGILEKQIAQLEKFSPYLAVQYLCKIIGYEGYLETELRKKGNDTQMREEWMDILSWLKEEAKQYVSLKEWIKAQGEYAAEIERHKKEKGKNVSSDLSKVQLMTVHASKGLEYDHVYIPDCNERIYPYGSMPDKEAVEEERRIFYVAMTRAKKSLGLLYLTGTKECPRLPSRFLNPLL